MSSLNLTPTLSVEPRFHCSSLKVTIQKENACSPWTPCFYRNRLVAPKLTSKTIKKNVNIRHVQDTRVHFDREK